MFLKYLKQGKPRLWLGGLRDMLQRTQSYYGSFNILLLLVTTYTVRETTIHKYAPWATFGVILGIAVILIIVINIIDHKWIYNSQVAYHQHIAWKNLSPVRRQVELLVENQNKMFDAIKRIEEKINEGNLLSG